MADPFARVLLLGSEVACYLRPGADCDVATLTRDLDEACAACGSIEELQTRVRSIADRHALDVEYDVSPAVPSDPVQRLVSMGFLPRS
jgi:hypothetical protein